MNEEERQRKLLETIKILERDSNYLPANRLAAEVGLTEAQLRYLIKTDDISKKAFEDYMAKYRMNKASSEYKVTACLDETMFRRYESLLNSSDESNQSKIFREIFDAGLKSRGF